MKRSGSSIVPHTSARCRKTGPSQDYAFASGAVRSEATHELELHVTTYGQDPKSVYTADNHKYTLTLKK
jgi:hypothetical protein